MCLLTRKKYNYAMFTIRTYLRMSENQTTRTNFVLGRSTMSDVRHCTAYIIVGFSPLIHSRFSSLKRLDLA